MTFAPHSQLRHFQYRHWRLAVVVNRSITFLEFLVQVPTNRICAASLNLGQLKILQGVITLRVPLRFATLAMQQPIKLDYLWAALCILGAVYFIFRAQDTR